MGKLGEITKACSVLGSLIAIGCASSAAVPIAVGTGAAISAGGLLLVALQGLSLGAAGNEVHQLINVFFRKQTKRKNILINHDIHRLVGKAILFVLEDKKCNPENKNAKVFYKAMIAQLTSSWEHYDPSKEFQGLTDAGIPAYFSKSTSGRLPAKDWVELLTFFSSGVESPGKKDYIHSIAVALEEQFGYVLLQLTKTDFAPGSTQSEFSGKAFAGIQLSLLKDISGEVQEISKTIDQLKNEQPQVVTDATTKALGLFAVHFHDALKLQHKELVSSFKSMQEKQTQVITAGMCELTSEMAEVFGTILTRLTQHNDQQQEEMLKIASYFELLHADFKKHRTANLLGPNDIGLESPLRRIDHETRENKANSSLHYSYAWDNFVGRQHFIDQLVDEFVAFDAPRHEQVGFQWTLIHGKAGSGKSRLALEMIRTARHRYRNILPKMCYGQNGLPIWWGMIKRRLLTETLKRDEIRRWDLNSPSLMIIDYAGLSIDLLTALEELKRLSVDYKQMVRVLLLDRRNDSEQINLLMDEEDGLREYMYQPSHEGKSNPNGILLEPIENPSNVVEIITRRIKSVRPLHEREKDGDWLLQLLDTIDDSGQRRPLFAGMVGQILASEFNPEAMEIDDWLEARFQLFESVVRIERHKWERHGQYSRSIREQHENLLALSTGCRGLPARIYAEMKQMPHLNTEGLRIPPKATSVDHDLLERMTSPLEKADAYGILEPDIIGEWYTLQRLQEKSLDVINPSAFSAVSWEIAKEGVSDFIFMCVQDHMSLVSQIGLKQLLPEPGSNLLEVIRLLRDILRELRAVLAETHTRRVAEPDDIGKAVAQFSAQVFDLISLWLNSTRTEKSCDEEVKTIVAESTSIYLNILFWPHSSNIRALTRLDYEETQALLDMPGRPLIERRQKLNTNRTAFARAMGYQAVIQQVDPSKLSGIITTKENIEEVDQSKARSKSLLQHTKRQTEEMYTPDPDTIVTNFGHGRRRLLAPSNAGITFTGEYIYILASKLLDDAAEFFRNLADKNREIHDEMYENASVFDQMSELIKSEPLGSIHGKKHHTLASQLLHDAGTFFSTLAKENPSIRVQMQENADVYRQIGGLLEANPIGAIE